MAAIVTLTMNPALDIATTTAIVVPTEKLRCSEPRYDPGGGGINVARAVHMLGGDAIAVFPVGGLSGEMLCRLLDGEGVPHVAVPIAGITRESLAVVERRSGQQFRFILPGPEIGPHDQERCLGNGDCADGDICGHRLCRNSDKLTVSSTASVSR
jgi:6-phosphofructokinase 2